MYKACKKLNQIKIFKRAAHTLAKKQQWEKGQQIHNYTVISQLPVPEMDLHAIHLKHISGAEHLHVSRQDSDNVFGVAFRTPPTDSTGSPHILEHVSLCGSKKYPVRDPFFKMLTRSLSTFMNAFTANDWTMYPFSSQNKTDFSNLLQVYLDAAFNPLLRKQDFLQEGWRLEQTKDSNFVLKGVVYNEMKGVFSNPHQVFSEATLNHLHSTGTYSFVSGGHPNHIPYLTWKQLKDFHAHHYHPANACFFTYGDFPLESHLNAINEHLLSQKHSSPSAPIKPQQRWSKPQRVHISCPVDPLAPDVDSSCMVSANYLLCDITKAQECFELSFLSTLLTDGPQSPFYRGLIESGLGADYSAGTGFSNEARDTSFSIGVQRCHKTKIEDVLSVIEKVFKEVVDKGFEEDHVNSVLHRIELSLKHQTDQFGLKCLLSLIPAWNHGAEPCHLLNVNHFVNELKLKMLENPGYLQIITEKYFIKNQHKLILTSHADPQYPEKEAEKETELLKTLVESLSEHRIKEINKEAEELLKAQERKEDVNCLPCLKVEEVAKDHERVQLKEATVEGFFVNTSLQATNGVTYLRLVLDASHLSSKSMSYLSLFCNLLTSMGAGHLNFREQAQQMELFTGGLHASPLISDHPSHPNQLQTAILLSSHCLDRNVPKMLELWSDIFSSLSLTDHNRLSVLLSSLAADSAAVLSHNGHRFAMKHSSSSLNYYFQQKEFLEGVTQMRAIKQFLNIPVEELLESIKELSNELLSSHLVRSSLHCQSSSLDANLKALSNLFCNVSVPKEQGTIFLEKAQKPTYVNTHIEAPFQVNYLARSFLTVPFSHSDYPYLRILSPLLSSKFLHKQIREKGGAYGGGSVATPNALQFFSYRDPNTSNTLEAFSNSVNWVCESSFNDDDLNEAKLSVFSQIDKPTPPGSKGLRNFLHGITEDEWSLYRQRLLAASKDDVVRVAGQYLKGSCSNTLIGPPTSSDYWNHKNKL